MWTHADVCCPPPTYPGTPGCAQVHWLRIIVDEGHSLGASLGLTNKLAMAVQLTAQRRWVMTGTPTPSTSSGGVELVCGGGGGVSGRGLV